MKKIMLIFLFILSTTFNCSAEQQLYPVEDNGNFGYIDNNGNMILSPQWEMASNYNSGYAIVGKNGQYESGLIDIQGNLCVEMEYNIEHQNGIYILRKPNGQYDLFGFFDPLSKTLVYPQYDFISHSHASKNSSLILAMKNYTIGFLDRFSGTLVIPFCYNEPADQAQFRNGLSLVVTAQETENGIELSYHLITEQNKKISFPHNYQAYSSVFHKISEEKVVLIDPQSGLFGFGKIDGTIVCNPQFDNVYIFSEGYAAICSNGLWGHIDENGKVIVEPCYDLYYGDDAPYGYEFSNGIAIVPLIDRFIAIDYQGNVLFEMNYENQFGNYTEIFPFQDNGLAFCKIDNHYGLINSAGEFIVPPIWQFDVPLSNDSFSSGLEAVSVDGKYGYINQNGIIQIDCQYEYAQNFSGELALVVIDGKKAYIDRTNNIIWMEQPYYLLGE